MTDHADIDHTGLTGVGGAFAGVRAYATGTVAVANNTWTSMALAAERFDSDAFHDTATNNSRFTIPVGKAGKYLIMGIVEFAPVAVAGQMGARIFLNGTTRIGGQSITWTNSATISTRLAAMSLYDLAEGDFVELQAWQLTGASRTTQNTANDAVEFWMQKAG